LMARQNHVLEAWLARHAPGGIAAMADHIGDLLTDYRRIAEEEGVRVVAETEHFLTFVPYAALSPFHTWIFPKNHSSCFGLISVEEIEDLAEIFKGAIIPLHEKNPDIFNAYIIIWRFFTAPRRSSSIARCGGGFTCKL